jgi:hypothetical protein
MTFVEEAVWPTFKCWSSQHYIFSPQHFSFFIICTELNLTYYCFIPANNSKYESNLDTSLLISRSVYLTAFWTASFDAHNLNSTSIQLNSLFSTQMSPCFFLCALLACSFIDMQHPWCPPSWETRSLPDDTEEAWGGRRLFSSRWKGNRMSLILRCFIYLKMKLILVTCS